MAEGGVRVATEGVDGERTGTGLFGQQGFGQHLDCCVIARPQTQHRFRDVQLHEGAGVGEVGQQARFGQVLLDGRVSQQEGCETAFFGFVRFQQLAEDQQRRIDVKIILQQGHRRQRPHLDIGVVQGLDQQLGGLRGQGAMGTDFQNRCPATLDVRLGQQGPQSRLRLLGLSGFRRSQSGEVRRGRPTSKCAGRRQGQRPGRLRHGGTVSERFRPAPERGDRQEPRLLGWR